MHKLESVIKNQTNEILWDLEIQADHLTPDRRSDLKINNKKNELPLKRICIPSLAGREKNAGRTFFVSCQRSEIAMDHEGMAYTYFSWCILNSS